MLHHLLSGLLLIRRDREHELDGDALVLAEGPAQGGRRGTPARSVRAPVARVLGDARTRAREDLRELRDEIDELLRALKE